MTDQKSCHHSLGQDPALCACVSLMHRKEPSVYVELIYMGTRGCHIDQFSLTPSGHFSKGRNVDAFHLGEPVAYHITQASPA